MSDSTTTRICKTCKESYPLDEDHFYKDSRYKGGYRPQCKFCCRNVQREWEKRTWDARLEYKRELYARNPEKHRQRAKAWRKNNPEKVYVMTMKWRRKNLERHQEMQKEWHENNPDYRKEYYRRDIQRSRKRARVKRHEYRARKRNAEGSHTPQDVTEIYNEQDGLCAYCGIRLHGEYHVDHVVPLSKGGSDSPDNLLCSCPYCNQSKKDKTLDEWILVRGW